MKIIRLWGVISFFVIVLLLVLGWYFIAPNLIASSIEKSGSEALGAKVEVDNIELGLFPLTVKINRLKATDPDQPMSNLVEINNIRFGVDSKALMWKKILIEELTLVGVQLNTKRKTSGAIEGGRATEKLASQISSVEIPELTEENIKEMVAKADLITVKRIELLNKSKNKLSIYWKKALDKKALNKRLKGLETEFNRLSQRAKSNKLNLLTDRKKWKSLKKNIDKERKAIGSLNKQLKQDKKILQQQIVAVKNGPNDDLNAIMKNVGLDNGVAGLSDKFLGPQFTPWITQGLSLLKGMKSDEAVSGEQKSAVYSTNKGQLVQFEDDQIFPDLLIKKINLSGKDGNREISGLGNNIGYFPWLVGEPSTLKLALNGSGSAQLNINSDWKDENNMKTKINSSIKQWPIKNMKLMETEQGSWMVNSGQLNSVLTGDLTLKKINLKLAVNLLNPKIATPSNLSGWKKTLAASLNQQKQFKINIMVSGTIENPKIKVDSSIEKLFSQAIGAKIKEQASKLKGKIKKTISDKVGDLSFLDGITGDFSSWSEQLKTNDGLLSKLKF